MWPFRKKKQDVAPPQIVCAHKYKDFPFYSEWEWNHYSGRVDGLLKGKIIEPYVCLKCHKRIDKVLDEFYRSEVSLEEATTFEKEIEKQYEEYLQPRALVEDAINDLILIDPCYVEAYEKLLLTK